ncbi:Long-chain fatty acid transport protein 4 [Orchesella cincta]|uniref:Long-chain-fatty-acid--CoA ligase n=1 Tax=Orchesella cincta TaxID=48709 RepID=A0A1D2NAQ0_ORCCI|nr:Long-chain fatty acid transport protein 4 [Orchesella cincta]
MELFKATAVYTLYAWASRRMRNETIFKSLDKLVQKHPQKICFYYESEKWTYSHVQTMSFQVANFFQAQGYRKGDVVGLAMSNKPEMVCIVLGLSRRVCSLYLKIGVITALINCNLKGDSLEHCISVAKCKSVIFGSEMRNAFQEVWSSRQQSDKPQTDVTLYELDRYLDGLYPLSQKLSLPVGKSEASLGTFTTNDFTSCLRTTSSKPTVCRGNGIGSRDQEPHFYDTLVYIFTSGTTGMPKPARNSHSRQYQYQLNLFVMISGGYFIMDLQKEQNNIIYCPLPIYHAFAWTGIVCSLIYGTPLVIVPKFSASKFWSDIHYYKATICLYMGELCRFIVNQPPQPELERNHSLRIMMGAGVKPEVWEAFVKRFNVKKFIEGYGSTEGNCTLVNMEGKIGAAGYIPCWIRPIYSLVVIKIDEVSGEIIRDENTGMAIQCKEGEPGELVGKIVDCFPTTRYEGYTNKEASEKKVARNLFRQGDRYFRSGDIMTIDCFGYIYFKDRIGDTYRWKGENVSTAEVEGLILKLNNMRSTIVYGVKVPGTEGRAGMAAISDPDGTLDLNVVSKGIDKGLPSYARPIFVRCVRSEQGLSMTGNTSVHTTYLESRNFMITNSNNPSFSSITNRII